MNEAVENKELIYEFGKFVLDPQERTLLASGNAVHLTDKVFDTLLLLIRNNERLLTKDEMMSALWTDSFVEESNLAKNVSRLRKILNADGIELIETLPKRGYRFRADVKEIVGETSLRDSKEVPVLHRPLRLRLLIAAVGAVAVAIALGFYFWGRGKAAFQNEYDAVRLTRDAKNDTNPVWTKDGEIRFFRAAPKEFAESVAMQNDGLNQTKIKEFDNFGHGRWSPDDTKVVFIKPNDRSAVYLADANGSNEILLPFAPANFDWSLDGRKIAYQKQVRPGDADIFVYSIETAQSENVTNNLALDADPSFSPDGKQIAFASLRDGNAEIYLMNVDGSDVRRLTNHPAWENHPVFSPDGTTIAFPSDREGENADVYLMGVDGSNVRRLTNWPSTEYVEPGCWSPDGTKIAFVSDREGNDDIFFISAEIYRPRLILADEYHDIGFSSVSQDGKQIVYPIEVENKRGELRVFSTGNKQIRILLKTENADLAPFFSPDGEWIAFQNRIESNTEICLIRSDGSGFRNLTSDAARDVNPAFSPDGKQIVFSSNRGGNFGIFQLYLMNSDGSNQRRIYYSEKGMSVTPAWSPDGKHIIFSNDKEDDATGNFELFTIDPDIGDTEKRLTFRRRSDKQPAVSPNGKRIAFTSNTDGNSEIYVMNLDGTFPLRITRNAAEDISPQWSADGKRLMFASNRHGKFAIYEVDFPEVEIRGF